MADAQFVQVGHDAGRVAEGQSARLELKAVGRRGMAEAVAHRLRDGIGNPLAQAETSLMAALRAAEDQQFVGAVIRCLVATDAVAAKQGSRRASVRRKSSVSPRTAAVPASGSRGLLRNARLPCSAAAFCRRVRARPSTRPAARGSPRPAARRRRRAGAARWPTRLRFLRAAVAGQSGGGVPPVAECRPVAAGRQQVLIQLPKLRVRRAFRPRPAELGRGEGLGVLRIGNLRSPLERQGGELLAPAAPHRLDERRIVERAEERKGPLLAVFLAHEQQRHARREQQQAARQPLRRRRDDRAQAVAPARFPTWSWFCTQTTNRVRSVAPTRLPWRRRRKGL